MHHCQLCPATQHVMAEMCLEEIRRKMKNEYMGLSIRQEPLYLAWKSVCFIMVVDMETGCNLPIDLRELRMCTYNAVQMSEDEQSVQTREFDAVWEFR